MSPLVLWFLIGSITALSVLVTDFLIDTDNRIILYNLFGKSWETQSVEHFCKLFYPIECTLWTLLGPASVYFYWKRTKRLGEARVKRRKRLQV